MLSQGESIWFHSASVPCTPRIEHVFATEKRRMGLLVRSIGLPPRRPRTEARSATRTIPALTSRRPMTEGVHVPRRRRRTTTPRRPMNTDP